MSCLKVIAIVTTMLGLGATSVGAQESISEPPLVIPDVVVTGQTSVQTLQSFTRTAMTAPPGRRMARWSGDVCVEVRNIGAEHAAYLRDRVLVVAGEAGLGTGDPDCRNSILIVGSDDPDALARRMVEQEPGAFAPPALNTNLGRAALARFVTSDAPVRWWHVSLPVDADTGEQISSRMNSVTRGSRLRSDTRDDLKGVVIIIDVPRASAAPFDALSDYVAMVALTPVDPEPDLAAFPTVMNLFADGRLQEDVRGLTVLDRDYLRAFYATSTDHSLVAQQHSEVVRRMQGLRRERERDEEAGAEGGSGQ